MGLKFTLNERLETIQKLDETILENSKGRDTEKEVEDCGEFCAKVYRILARIDLSLDHQVLRALMSMNPLSVEQSTEF